MPQSAATSKINTRDVQTGQKLHQSSRRRDPEVEQVLVLLQCLRSIAPKHAGPPPMRAWWLPQPWGCWWPHLSPFPASAPALRGYRAILQKSLQAGSTSASCCILRRHITCHPATEVGPEGPLPLHVPVCAHWSLQSKLKSPPKLPLDEPAITRPLERYHKTCKKTHKL